MDRPDLAGDVADVAVGMLGARLVSDVGGERTSISIVEVEAYGGLDDPASHAHRGRTKTNGAMYGEAGTLYVYRSHGIYRCCNVVAGARGEAAAVLIRAGRPLEGVDVMVRRRGRDDHVADGPGKLGQALGIELDHDGLDLLSPSSPIRLEAGERPRRFEATPRIGISRAVERPWRFAVRD